MPSVVILGAGMAGYGAAHRLTERGVSSTTFDRNPFPGGHTASFVHPGGFTFDDGPHVSFTKDERIQGLLASAVDDAYEVIDTRVNNYWQGHWIKHPAQCNLHGLPVDLVVKIIEEFVAAAHAEPGAIATYQDWLFASYGETFSRTFPMEYGLKYHTTTAANMSTDWLGPRLYQPNLGEVLRGALSPTTADVHYASHFRYPSHGGFVSYLRPQPELTRLHLSHEVVGIDPKARRLRFAGGLQVAYDALVSSLPLPVLMPLIDGVPQEVLDAAAQLSWSTCVTVNLGIDRPDISEHHWTYFYDRDFLTTRISFPHMQSPHNVPPGASSIQAEIYYSARYRPLDREPEACIDVVIAELRRCGILREDDRILFRNAVLVPFANVIFDLARARAVEIVHGYLDDLAIAYCGRYGLWGYQWTDESFKSGEQAAERILK